MGLWGEINSGLGICSFAHLLSALSLKIAHFKEQPWAIRSRCSLQKSTLRAIRSWFELIALKKQAIFMFCSIFKRDLSDLLPSLFTKEQCKWSAQVPQNKWATLSDSLRSLIIKIRRERFTLFHERIALSLTKNEWITQKTNERIPNPE